MMTITYETGDGLYVNITNRCSNSCDFCIRKLGPGAYGSDSLWLDREPTVDEITESILARDLTKYAELVFCGYGETTERIDDMIEVARRVKAVHPMKIRVNTNGHARLLHPGKDVTSIFEGAIDIVSISLNTANAADYQKVCHSRFGEAAYDALIKFAGDVRPYVSEVLLSVVRGSIPDEDIEICRTIADKVGVTLRVRDLIK